MGDRIDVFISSTSKDLEDYREKVKDVILRLGAYPIAMEDFNPTDRNALQLCYEKVQEAEVFVGIYAYRYGYAPGKDTSYETTLGEIRTGDGKTSITNWEYIWAIEKGLPLFLFVVSEKNEDSSPLEWPVVYIEDEPGKSQLQAFKNEIMNKHVVGFFYSPDNLALQVSTSLQDTISKKKLIVQGIEAEQQRIQQEAQERSQSWKRKSVGQRLVDVAYFYDRDSEQQRIGQLLASPATRIISIISRGGMGKTALACKILADLEKNHFPHIDKEIPVDGVIYLSTRTSGVSLERIFLSIAQLTGGETEKAINVLWTNQRMTLHEKIYGLLEYLREGLYIILLDNMEDLVGADGNLRDPDLQTFFDLVVRAEHGARLVVTSRIPLTFQREVMQHNLEVPLLEGLPEREGISMLRVLDPNGEFGLRDAPEEQLARAVALVKGVPRALEVMAGILANDFQISLDELLSKAEIFHHPEFVEELVKENYGRLDPESRQVIEALAVFGKPVPEVAIAFLLEPFAKGIETTTVLKRLIKNHIVSWERSTKVAFLHPIDRDYIYNQLPKEGNYSRNTLNDRAADYYAQLQVDKKNWQSIEDLSSHLREYDHRFEAKNYDAAARVLDAISLQLNLWGYTERNFQMIQAVEGKINTPLVQALNAVNLGFIFTLRNEEVEAIACFERAQRLAATTQPTMYQNLKIQFNALKGMGITYRKVGKNLGAAKCYEQAIALRNNHAALVSEVEPLGPLGFSVYVLGDQEKAILYLTEAIKRARERHDEWEDTYTNVYLGIVYSALAQFEKAIQCFEYSLSIADRINAARVRCHGRIEMAAAKIRADQYQDVLPILQKALQIAREIESEEHLQYAQYVLAKYYWKLGNREAAFHKIAEASKLSSRWLDYDVAIFRGILSLRLGGKEAAGKAFIESLNYAAPKEAEDYWIPYACGICNAGLALLAESPETKQQLMEKAVRYMQAGVKRSIPRAVVDEANWLLNELGFVDESNLLLPAREVLHKAQ